MYAITSYAIFVVLFLFGGCATTTVTTATASGSAYRPLELVAAEPASALLAAAESVVVELDAVKVQSDGQRLTASIPVETGVRDTLTIEARDGRLRIAYQTQMAEHGRWITPATVCAGYSHARERALAQKILAAVPMRMASAWR